MRFIARNIGYLYKRYTPEFYYESYIYMTIGLVIAYLLKFDMFSDWVMIVISIINIITYPFTRFFYYWCKENLFFNIHYKGLILGLVFRFLAFMIIWTFSFLPGTCCIIYILLNENAKEYNRAKANRKEYYSDNFM